MSSELRQKWWSRPLGRVVWFCITLVCTTLRFRVNKKAEWLRENRAIVALWHNRIFTPCYVYRYKLRGQVPMSMLTSASKDGAMLATVAQGYGMRAVRGSSRRRGAAGFMDMIKELEDGCSMCITPDGPKGPLYHCHPGVVKLASLSGVPIVPLRFHYHSKWRASSWDGFMVPLPFSRVDLQAGDPIQVPADLSDEELDSWCRRLEQELGGDDDSDICVNS